MRIDLVAEDAFDLVLTSEQEWNLFEQLAIDVKGRGEGWLAKRFGVLVDDEDWDELVAPELTEKFQEDVKVVQEIVARSFAAWQQEQNQEAVERVEPIEEDELEDEEEYGLIPITAESSAAWYSVLNQARLAIEGKWKLSILKESEDFNDIENLGEERLAAFIRDNFYTRLQGALLELLLEI